MIEEILCLIYVIGTKKIFFLPTKFFRLRSSSFRSLNFDISVVSVEESIVNAPRITDHGSALFASFVFLPKIWNGLNGDLHLVAEILDAQWFMSIVPSSYLWFFLSRLTSGAFKIH
jgi:hypothetical protein